MSLSNLRRAVERRVEAEESFEEQFLKDYNKAYYQIEQERKQEMPDDYYRPSSLGPGCKRMLAFQKWGAPTDNVDFSDEWTYNLIRITENGTDRHTRIQDVIKKMEELGLHLENLDVEQVIEEARHRGINSRFVEWDEEHKEARCANDDLKIWFKADGVFKYRSKEVLFEVKTANGFKFQKIVNSNQPLIEHIRQDTCYSMGLGIDYVLYLYEDRNFLKTHVILYKISDEDKQYIRDKVDEVERIVSSRIVPPMEEDKCKYCEYTAVCRQYLEGDFFQEQE